METTQPNRLVTLILVVTMAIAIISWWYAGRHDRDAASSEREAQRVNQTSNSPASIMIPRAAP